MIRIAAGSARRLPRGEDVHVDGPGSVPDLVALLARGAGVRDEPELDGLAHALQCGAILRAEHPDDPELAVAGLVHDIADIAYPDDHTDHDRRGATLVEPLLGLASHDSSARTWSRSATSSPPTPRTAPA